MNKFTIKDSHMHFDNSQMYLEKIKNKQGNECIHQQGFTYVFWQFINVFILANVFWKFTNACIWKYLLVSYNTFVSCLRHIYNVLLICKSLCICLWMFWDSSCGDQIHKCIFSTWARQQPIRWLAPIFSRNAPPSPPRQAAVMASWHAFLNMSRCSASFLLKRGTFFNQAVSKHRLCPT